MLVVLKSSKYALIFILMCHTSTEFAGVFLCSTIIFMLGWWVFIKKPHTRVRYRCSCRKAIRKVCNNFDFGSYWYGSKHGCTSS